MNFDLPEIIWFDASLHIKSKPFYSHKSNRASFTHVIIAFIIGFFYKHQ